MALKTKTFLPQIGTFRVRVELDNFQTVRAGLEGRSPTLQRYP
ncbi:hypothetical protein [Leptolyngbya sp. FACHB-541]|nr:hypothetical protein [Leptolyngbya sp. FACHB-541]